MDDRCKSKIMSITEFQVGLQKEKEAAHDCLEESCVS